MSSEFRKGARRFVYDLGDLDSEALDASEEPERLADRAPDGVRRRSYDSAFEPAVAEGLLTVQDAWARGSRALSWPRWRWRMTAAWARRTRS